MPSGFYLGDSGAEGGIGGIVGVETGDVGTPNTTTETTLHSITLPGNAMPLFAGHAIVRVRTWGTFADTVRNKITTLYFGGSPICQINSKDLTTDFPDGAIWEMTADVTGDRVNQSVRTRGEISDPDFGQKTVIGSLVGPVAEDGTAGIVVKCTGTNTYVAYNAEAHTIPDDPGPYTVTVDHAPNIVDVGSIGRPWPKVVGPPNVDEYSVDETTGVYTFNASNKLINLTISYQVVSDVTNDIVGSGLIVEYLSSAD